MGHIGHLRNQLKSMNTFERIYDYIYYKTGPVVQEEEIFKFHECTFAIFLLSPNVKRWGVAFPFEQTQILFTQGSFMLNLVEIGPVVL